MFFIGIFGILQKEKELDYNQTEICSCCGRFGRLQVFYCYTYFHFFFLPLFRWNQHYYIKMSCCAAVYELNPEIGTAIRRGENPQITQKDLTLYHKNNKLDCCPNCGRNLEQSFEYCPKCGWKL